MPSSRTVFIAINVVFGPLVLASYVASAQVWPAHVGALWGGVPEGWRLPYTVNMFLAAAGYLAFTWHLFRHAKPKAPASSAASDWASSTSPTS